MAQGGRYDFVGEVFGRNAREATGFSIDLVNLAKESAEQISEKESVLVSGFRSRFSEKSLGKDRRIEAKRIYRLRVWDYGRARLGA